MENNFAKTKLKKQDYKEAESTYSISKYQVLKQISSTKKPEQHYTVQAFSASNRQNYFGSLMASFSLGAKISEAITDKISTPPTIDKDSGEEM